MRIGFIITCMFLFPKLITGQDYFTLLHDKDLSAISYGQNLYSVHKLIYSYENKLIKPKYWNEEKFIGKSLGIGYRLAKSFVLDYQIDYLTFLTQHEVFGHGYRFREFGYKNSSYEINLPRPFGTGGGLARWGDNPGRILGQSEQSIVRSGGMEANAILAKTIIKSTLRKGEINYRESLLFTFTSNDYTYYIRNLTLHRVPMAFQVGDVAIYLRSVNISFGFSIEKEYPLSIFYLRKHSLLNLFNSFQLISFYSFIVEYLYKGNETFEYPMIKIGEAKYLPSLRFGLTPFGSEFILDNYILSGDKKIEINLKIGDGKLAKFWSMGYAMDRPVSANTDLSYSLDIWHQPELLLGGLELQTTRGGVGGKVIGALNHRFDAFPIGLVAKVGYKTDGYSEGERLDNGLILRMGLTVRNFTNGKKSDKSEMTMEPSLH